MRSGASTAAAALLLLGCAPAATLHDGAHAYESTYLRKLASAERGDAEAQNAVGFMLYRGDGVAADRLQAKRWFEHAAAQGNARARRNLAYIAAAAPQQVFAAKAGTESPQAQASAGERSYVKFCGGCHGVDGVAAYENSPSFAFGERLHKPDALLMASLLDGRQEMPGWEGKLPVEELREILAHVRTLPARYDAGIGAWTGARVGYVYLFGPMDERARAAGP
jgi:mono/diheme cytochrome c family protein